MAEKAIKTSKNKNTTNIILGICAAVVAVVIIVVAIVLVMRNNGELSDAYFVSDGTKYVLNLGPEDLTAAEGEPLPVKAHIVYYYTDDKVTDVKAYYEFANAADAENMYISLRDSSSDVYQEIALNGKFVILTSNAADYENLTASDIKQQIEYMESHKNSGSSAEATETVIVEDSGDSTESAEPTNDESTSE